MDQFFYHGKNDLTEEIEHDILLVLIQPKGSLFYNRAYGAGIPEYENMNSGLMMEIGLRFDAAEAVALRNTRVSTGEDGRPDRRALTSQRVIGMESVGGEVEITVEYVRPSALGKRGTITFLIGGSRHAS